MLTFTYFPNIDELDHHDTVTNGEKWSTGRNLSLVSGFSSYNQCAKDKKSIMEEQEMTPS